VRSGCPGSCSGLIGLQGAIGLCPVLLWASRLDWSGYTFANTALIWIAIIRLAYALRDRGRVDAPRANAGGDPLDHLSRAEHQLARGEVPAAARSARAINPASRPVSGNIADAMMNTVAVATDNAGLRPGVLPPVLGC